MKIFIYYILNVKDLSVYFISAYFTYTEFTCNVKIVIYFIKIFIKFIRMYVNNKSKAYYLFFIITIIAIDTLHICLK